MRLTLMTVPLSHVRIEGTALILSMNTIAPAQWNMLSVLAIRIVLHNNNCIYQHIIPCVYTAVCFRATTVPCLEMTAFQTHASIMGHALIGRLIMSVFAARDISENSVRKCTKQKVLYIHQWSMCIFFTGENTNSDVFILATPTHTPQQGVRTHTHTHVHIHTHASVHTGSQSQVHTLINVCVCVCLCM